MELGDASARPEMPSANASNRGLTSTPGACVLTSSRPMTTSAQPLFDAIAAPKCYQSVYAGDPRMLNPLKSVELGGFEPLTSP